MFEQLPLFPEQASTVARSVDLLYFYLVAVSGFFTTLIFVCIFYFAVKYRRRPGLRPVQDPAAQHAGGHYGLEVVWMVIPFGLTLVMFTWGSSLFIAQQRVPEGAMEIIVVGKQWMWKLQHPNGRWEINELHVPVGQPIQLTLASEDVIHSFYIPAFRVKMDVVPGRYTTMWFEATRPGRYHLFCAEYCGAQHSRMIGSVVVLNPDEFQRWLGGVIEESPVQAGERLFEQYDCVNCHHTGARARGPQLGGRFGMPVQLADGRTVVFDEAHVRESILNPMARVSAGYPPVMPSFRGQLTEEQILQIIAYIRSLTPAEAQ